MTVKELIEKLKLYPQDLHVMLACDEEANQVLKLEYSWVEQFRKTNNNGSYDALLLSPATDEVYIYDPSDDREGKSY